MTDGRPRHPGTVAVSGMTPKEIAIHLDDLEFAGMIVRSHAEVEDGRVSKTIDEDRETHEFKTRIGTVCHTWQILTDQDTGRTSSTVLLEMSTSNRICIFSIGLDVPGTRPDRNDPRAGVNRIIDVLRTVLTSGFDDVDAVPDRPNDDHMAAHAMMAANASGMTVDDLDAVTFATPWSPALLEKTDGGPRIMIRTLREPVVTSVMRWNDGAERVHVGALMHIVHEESLDPMRMLTAQAEIAGAARTRNTQAKRIPN